MASWSFLTNYGLVLAYLCRHPDSTGLEITQAVGITECAARKIVADLPVEAFVERDKVGRRNRYRLDTSLQLRHPGERTVTVGELLGPLWRDHLTAADVRGGDILSTVPDEDGTSEETATNAEVPSTERNGDTQ